MCKTWIVIAWLFTLLLLARAQESSAGQEDRNAAVLREIRAFDSAILTNITVKVRSKLPRVQTIPETERLVRSSTLTIKGDVWACRDDVDPNLGPPKYREPGKELPWSDYDRKTRELFVWRDIKRAALYEPDFQGVYRSMEMFRVKPDGQASRQNAPSVISLERPLQALELVEFYTVFLSAGRGYGRLIDQISECTETKNGLLDLRAFGRWVDGTLCHWELVVEPLSSFTVRYAKAARRDNAYVIVEIRNEGTQWYARGPLPVQAKLLRSPSDSENSAERSWEIVYLGLEDKADEKLINDCRALLRGKYEEGTDILDHRTGNTVRTIVGEVQRTPIPEDEPILDDPILKRSFSFDWFPVILFVTTPLVVFLILGGALWRRRNRGS